MGLIWLLLVVLSLNQNDCRVKGERFISREEDLELERQLKMLNKPAVKTVLGESGVFDCVSIYKQPAFDNPLLKNHKIKMRPTSLPHDLITIGTAPSVDKHHWVTLNSIDCPQGTVPIRRVKKEDLIRAKSLSATSIRPQIRDYPGNYKAILSLINSANKTYYGVQSFHNVYNLTLNRGTLGSSSQVWIESNPAVGRINSLQVGWMVMFEHDNRPYSFAVYSLNHGRTRCMNLFCSAFVQVDQKHALGDVITPSSTYGGDQYVMRLALFQDFNSKDWWIYINEVPIGYYPKKAVPNLVGGFTNVAWGGLVDGLSYEVSSPMGNGFKPALNYTTACFVSQIHLIDETNHLIDISEDDVIISAQCPRYYSVTYGGYVNAEMRQSIMFGGPGGDCRDGVGDGGV